MFRDPVLSLVFLWDRKRGERFIDEKDSDRKTKGTWASCVEEVYANEQQVIPRIQQQQHRSFLICEQRLAGIEFGLFSKLYPCPYWNSWHWSLSTDKVSHRCVQRVEEGMKIASVLDRPALNHVHRFQEICCWQTSSIEASWLHLRLSTNAGEGLIIKYFRSSDPSMISDVSRLNRVIKIFFIVYEHPINVLLKHSRSLFNHSFPIHTTDPSHSTEWISTQVNQPDRVLKSFRTIQVGHSKSLCIAFFRDDVSIALDEWICNGLTSC